MSQTILAYIPVLHQGYYQFFTQQPPAEKLLVIPASIAQEFTPTHKEIRALQEDLIISAIMSWKVFSSVEICSLTDLEKLNNEKSSVTIPDEVVTRELARKYLSNCAITKTSIFLRWDRENTTQATTPHASDRASQEQLDKRFMELAKTEGEKSSDWWRRVGAIAVSGGKVLGMVHNTHLPSEQQPYAESDPRAHFHKGEHIELTTAIHAEAKLIAEAAATGCSLAGADLYVTDFPCPPCAKLIATAQIKRLFYTKGYAMLDGERVLKTAGVEIIQVI